MPASIFATARPVSAPVGRAALRASTGLPTGRPVETVMHLLRNYFGARPNTALVGAFRESKTRTAQGASRCSSSRLRSGH